MDTEIMVVEARIFLAKELELQQVIIESDSLPVVQSSLAKEVSGEIGHLVQGILSLMECFSSWKIRHLKRDYNKVAHELVLLDVMSPARCGRVSPSNDETPHPPGLPPML